MAPSTHLDATDGPFGAAALRDRHGCRDGRDRRGRLLRAALGRDRRGQAETRTKVVESGAARRVGPRRRPPDRQTSLRCGAIDDIVRRASAERLDRAGEDLVAGRPRALLGRPGQIGGRYALGRRSSADSCARAGPSRRGERARPAGERARPRAGRVDRGVYARSGRRRARRCSSRSTSGSTLSMRARAGSSRELAPPILGAIALLVLVQVPLVWSLMRGLQRGYEDREALLANAIAGSNRERRRLAVVPARRACAGHRRRRLLARTARRRGRGTRGRRTRPPRSRPAIDNLRHSVRDLRTLLVDLHPPHLAAAGSRRRSRDLVSPLEIARDRGRVVGRRGGAPRPRARGTRVPGGTGGHSQHRRSRRGHAGDRERDRYEGRGPARRLRRRPRLHVTRSEQRRVDEGHLGLSLLEELVRQAGGTTRDPLGRGRGNDGRAGGAGSMTRVVIADDHGVLRDGLGRVIAAQPDMRAGRHGRERRRGGRALPASRPPTWC